MHIRHEYFVTMVTKCYFHSDRGKVSKLSLLWLNFVTATTIVRIVLVRFAAGITLQTALFGMTSGRRVYLRQHGQRVRRNFAARPNALYAPRLFILFVITAVAFGSINWVIPGRNMGALTSTGQAVTSLLRFHSRRFAT